MNNQVKILNWDKFNDSFLTPEFYNNPYPYYRFIQKTDSTHWNDKLNAWLVTDYETVISGLKDSHFSSNRKQNFFSHLTSEEQTEIKSLKDFFQLWLMFMDPPFHDKLKVLFTKPFSPSSIQQYSSFVELVSENTYKKLSNKKEIDFLSDYAIPISTRSLALVLGVEANDYNKIVHWSEQILNFLSDAKADMQKGKDVKKIYDQLTDYLQEVIVKKRNSIGNDMITIMVEYVKSGQLKETELIAIVANLLVDGHEPISHTLSNGLIALMDHPEQLKLLRNNLNLIPASIEEMMRYNPYFQYSARRATEDLTLADKKIKQDQRVMFLLGAANRDPQYFDSPEEFNITRTKNRHLSFGHGSHYCLGAALARLTCQIAMKVFLSQNHEFIFKSNKIEWRNSLGYRGVIKLPIKLI